jgi:hypothetical protein
MADQDRTSAETAHDQIPDPAPVTPSEQTERPEGLAFDVEKGADLPGVPVGDQHPANPGTAPARESGDGVGLAVPGDDTESN